MFGLSVLVMLGWGIAKRLPPEYRSRQTPTILTVAIVWTFLAVHFALVALAAIESTWQFSLSRALAMGSGFSLIAVGAAMYFGAAYAFHSFSRLQGLETTRLVTEGVYQWSRNPQTVGWTLLLVGVGLLRQSAMVLVLAGVFWMSFRLYLPVEEELVHRLFGDAYERYRARTHRYFGPPRRQLPQ
jgi:protein-S-isoprenylcysteine O-methyltransferase Ste14